MKRMRRPRTRGECVGGPRPCPWVGCRYHLYLDVDPYTGRLKINFPGLSPLEIPWTCALDVAEYWILPHSCAIEDRHPRVIGEGNTLELVGLAIHLTRERVRQIEQRAMRKLLWRVIHLREIVAHRP